MGLIVPQTVKVRTNPSNYKHYKEKGYIFKKCGDFIEVNVLDLPKESNIKVKVICDVCGKENETWYRTVVKCNKENKLITCGSNSCKNKKYEDTCMEKYGVKHVFQAEEVKEKTKQTNLERYGCENPSQNQEIKDKKKKTCQLHFRVDYSLQDGGVREKIKNTNLKRYRSESPFGSKEIRNKAKKTWQKKYGKNITCTFQVESVKNKIKNTNLKRYGSESPFGSKEIQDKIKVTLKERYGSKSYFSSDDFKNKTRDTWSFNGYEGPCSRQQKYIANLVNGKINEVIAGYWADIYIEKENVVIEYDGGGHFLGDIMNGNAFPTKESILREKEREDKIINNGYRMIRFIAAKDRIPSDEVILNLIEEFKNSDFKIIRINFEEGTIEKDYEEKSHYDFGELRKITQKDLEQF